MIEQDDLLMDFSILSRTTQKYYDRRLEPFGLTYGQLPVLLMVYENPGISLNDIVKQGQYDKGTVTKNVQKLEALGYLLIEPGKKDKRVKNLYPTDEAKNITVEAYRIQQDWWSRLVKGLDSGQTERLMARTRHMVDNAKDYETGGHRDFQTFRLVDCDLKAWPGKLAAIIQTAGCNFRCPGCPRKDSILPPKGMFAMDPETVLEKLEEKRVLLDGVVIQGGEPLLQAGLEPFLEQLKERGWKVRLVTNGSDPEKLERILDNRLVDSILLEESATPEQAGLLHFDAAPIQKSRQLLEASGIEFEIVEVGKEP